MQKRTVLILVYSAFFLFGAQYAFAGFGITPPYVKNDSLIRNSKYQQTIVLSRSDAVDDLQVNVTTDVPGADDWISIDKGSSFVMHQGENQLPMIVTVNIPGGASFKDYKGNIRVVLSPLSGPTPGTVGIALGAQIDVDFNVIDKKIYDFKVHRVEIAPLEEGHKWWMFFFPGKIRFSMQIENTGNVRFSPTKVVFDIRSSSDGPILETTQNLGGIEKINPFEIKNVITELPTRLTPGGYKASYRIYNNDLVAGQGELDLSILPYGAIPGYKGFGFIGLTYGEQTIIIFAALVLLTAVFWIGRRLYRFVRR